MKSDNDKYFFPEEKRASREVPSLREVDKKLKGMAIFIMSIVSDK